ncbi:hypothetical protein BCD48_41615 [Pseudofrankia sp. BMG5.36]|nr:hypothetical protein BCD48_41615 [Pseudofrankia sp. BMG5.36]
MPETRNPLTVPVSAAEAEGVAVEVDGGAVGDGLLEKVVEVGTPGVVGTAEVTVGFGVMTGPDEPGATGSQPATATTAAHAIPSTQAGRTDGRRRTAR